MSSYAPPRDIFDSRLGVEDFSRQAYLVIFEGVNAALDAEGARWAQSDMDFNALIQRPAINASLEHFTPRTMHPGHRPSMIEAPVDQYPSLAVMAYRIAPLGDQNEAADNAQVSLSVETIVRSGPFRPDDKDGDGETALNRRLLRTVEALHKVLLDARDIVGWVPPERSPTAIMGEIWARDAEVNEGDRWYFQGARMEWTFSKQSFFNNIDQ